jgi:hypothetical protein
MEEDLPQIAGLSIVYLLFAALAIYNFLFRLRALARTWLHPVFIAAYALLVLAVMMEYLHPEPSTDEINRTALMVVAGVFIAAMFRDRTALQVCTYAYIITGLAVSIFLFLAMYGTLQRSTATNFNEASDIRTEAWKGSALDYSSPNTMAFYCAQGAVAALALALVAKTFRYKQLFFGFTLICLVGAFLPMSRGGILIAVLSCGAVMFSHGVRHVSTIVAGFVLAVGILIVVPDAVFHRLTFTTQRYEGSGKLEGRAHVYTATLKHFPDYVLTGVGAGHFWGSWGERSAFGNLFTGGVGGAHNGPAQILIYWGLPALLAFAALGLQCYRCLPFHQGDAFLLAVVGIAISLLLFFQVHHVLNAKQFSLGLGLLAGGSTWIWPNHISRSASRQQ